MMPSSASVCWVKVKGSGVVSSGFGPLAFVVTLNGDVTPPMVRVVDVVVLGVDEDVSLTRTVSP
jgi:hypothetical protein